MGHPLHLHGHKFWVLGSGEGTFPYKAVADAPTGMLNPRNPPFCDTTGLPSQGWTVIRYVCFRTECADGADTHRGTNRYVTDNPGAWIFHCHLQWHIVVSDFNCQLPSYDKCDIQGWHGDGFSRGQ